MSRWPGWTWVPDDRKTAWLCGMLIGASIFFSIGIFRSATMAMPKHPFGDYFAFWSFAKIVFSQPAADLYDFEKIHHAQVALGMPPQLDYPFAYPPVFLLLIWPFGLLSYQTTYVIWGAATLLLYLIANSVGPISRAMLVATALAPTTAACLLLGQTGFLFAALLVGGLRLIPYRPILAGTLLGMLIFKPQFGILLPIALIARNHWRCIVAACTTAMTLIGVTAAFFGVSIWITWWHALPVYGEYTYRMTAGSSLIPTVLANLQIFGYSDDIAWTVQIMVAAVAAVVTWAAWRRLPQSLAVPLLLAAACLATPRAFLYDLPMLSSAVLLFAAHRLRSVGALLLPEIIVIILVLAVPVLMSLREVFAPLSTISIISFIALVLLTGRAPESSSAPACQEAKA